MKVMLAIFLLAMPLAAQKPVPVKPHITRQGKLVQPHIRTSPNKTRLDNYSTKGNVNPMTGKKGTADPLSLPRPRKK